MVLVMKSQFEVQFYVKKITLTELKNIIISNGTFQFCKKDLLPTFINCLEK